MSYQLSDEDSTDSDTGIRFKTDSIRNKPNHKESSNISSVRNQKRHHVHRESIRSARPSEKKHYRSSERSYSRDRRKRSTSQENRRHHKRKSKRTSEKNRNQISTAEQPKPHKDKTSKKSEEIKYQAQSIQCKQKDMSGDCNKKPGEKEQLKQQNSNVKSDIDSNSNNDNSESGKRTVKNESTTIKKICRPAFPPSFMSKQPENESDTFGPALPPRLTDDDSAEDLDVEIHGPSLPPHLLKTDKKSENQLNNSDKNVLEPALTFQNVKNEDMTSVFGPALPPYLKKSPNKLQEEVCRTKIVGPDLPPHLRAKLAETEISDSPKMEQIVISDDDYDDLIGPLPEGHLSSNPSHTLLEERALQMKLNQLIPSGPEPTVREEWMLELPDVQSVQLGLGPRQFRTKAGPDMSDRSSWTDTPQEKLKKGTGKSKPSKTDIKKEAELKRIKERDHEQEKIIEKHKKKKKRDKALIDMHQEKLKKKKKKEAEDGKIEERRPFDRDIDLKVNRFDEAQKKAILKKAQLLDNRFSSGESKFL